MIARQGVEAFSVQAACLSNQGTLRRLDLESAAQDLRKRTSVTWIHLLVHDFEAGRRFLVDELALHPLSAEDALSELERPALQEFDDHLFLSAAAVEDVGTGEEFVEVGFFLLKYGLVTVATKPAPGFEEWFDRWCERARSFGRTSADLMHALLDAIVDGYFPVTDRLEDQVEALADSIYLGNQLQLQEAMALKRRLLEVRRRITPIRDIVNGLLRRDIALVPPDVRPYLQDVYDHTLRIADIVDINRETLATTLDTHVALVSNNLNMVMRKMTVYATILMSMALVAGIYGMNFRFMPELDWRLGYPLAIGLMALVGLVEWHLFRRKHWL